MTEHGDQSDETLIVKLTVAEVEVIHTAEVSISEDLASDLVDPSLGEGVASNFDSFNRPELQKEIYYTARPVEADVILYYNVTFIFLIECSVPVVTKQPNCLNLMQIIQLQNFLLNLSQNSLTYIANNAQQVTRPRSTHHASVSHSPACPESAGRHH